MKMTREDKTLDFSGSSTTSKFLLSFIQALLKTGYYTPDHRETSKAREGLYRDFVSIIKNHRELTFVVAAGKETRDIMVDGIVDEPAALSSFMLKGMSEMFVPKFLAFFDRKNLSSFSIKSAITKNEFDTFIDIMSESPSHEAQVDTREQLTLDLIKKSILHISTVFNIDLVGKERELPWRVEIALTRLKKDLSLIPLYKNVQEEKITELKNMVFDDIIRPIRSHNIIKDIIINLDIISPEIAGISREEFEDRITDFIHKDLLLRAAPGILDFFLSLKESYEKIQDETILERLAFTKKMAKKIGFKLMNYGITDERLLMDFFHHGILVFDELPDNLQARARRRGEVDKFLREPQKYLSALDRAKNQEEMKRAVSTLLNLLPELFERGLFTELQRILERVQNAGFNFSSLESMLIDEIAESIERKSSEGTKGEQAKVMDSIFLIGTAMIPVLISFLTHKSRLVRKIACEQLVKHGTESIPLLTRSLEERNDWYHVRNVIMILAEAGKDSPELEEIFKEYMHHQEPKVRVEAVYGMINLLGPGAEETLMKALNDESPLVRKKAVWALGKIPSVRAEVIEYYIDTLTGKQKEDDFLIEQVLTTIQNYPVHLDETGKLEQAILEALVKRQGILGRFSSGYVYSDHLRTRMFETLKYMGSQKSIDILTKIAKKDSHLMRMEKKTVNFS
jgi:hypothetical protein